MSRNLVLKIKEAKLEHLVIGTLLVYISLHLLEEGIFGFPAWAEGRWGIPNYTVSKWLLHNCYFVFFLVVGYFIYRISKERLLPVGVGIVIWGLLNGLSHIVFSVIFLEYSPGLFTGLIFLLFAVLALKRIREMGKLSPGLMLPSILFGLLYWGLPIALFITVDKMLGI